MNPFFHTDFSISDSLKTVRKSVLIYETIIIYGFILMFILLQFKVIKDESVKDVGAFLVEIMPLMFIPGAVAILDSWEYMKDFWHILFFIIMITTILVMVVSGKVTDQIVKWEEKSDNESDNC